jgi:hypothetical protein
MPEVRVLASKASSFPALEAVSASPRILGVPSVFSVLEEYWRRPRSISAEPSKAVQHVKAAQTAPAPERNGPAVCRDADAFSSGEAA